MRCLRAKEYVNHASDWMQGNLDADARAAWSTRRGWSGCYKSHKSIEHVVHQNVEHLERLLERRGREREKAAINWTQGKRHDQLWRPQLSCRTMPCFRWQSRWSSFKQARLRHAVYINSAQQRAMLRVSTRAVHREYGAPHFAGRGGGLRRLLLTGRRRFVGTRRHVPRAPQQTEPALPVRREGSQIEKKGRVSPKI